MRRSIRQWLVALVMVLYVPWVLVRLLEPPEAALPPVASTQPTQSTWTLGVILPDGSVADMELEEYLVGVVLREMPQSFAMEAKKAQAVAARTYALKQSLAQKHPGGLVCTDSSCCQAYRDPWTFLAGGGSPEAVEQARQAVEQTRGLVAVYDGALIDATYFSCSGGRTETAVAVWGTEVAYLQSVESPGEEQAAHYTDTVSFTPEQLAARLGQRPEGAVEDWFGAVTYTDGGGVESMRIGSVTYTGRELRTLLGLRSTAFSVSVMADTVWITTRGYGHRVGMSQYGADAMAREGSTWQEILGWYYPGTAVIDKAGILG